jgi:filamentous hemagglutinin
MGTLNIGGTLDENGLAIGKAKDINNLSASIESGSDMGLSSEDIKNIGTVVISYEVLYKNLLTDKIINQEEFNAYTDTYTGSRNWEQWKGYRDGLEGIKDWLKTNNYYDYLLELFPSQISNLNNNDEQEAYLEFIELQSYAVDTSIRNPSYIISGGNMSVDASSVTNKDAAVISVGNMVLNINNLNNTPTQIAVNSKEVDRTIHWRTEHNTFKDNDVYLNYGFVEKPSGTTLVGGESKITAGGTITGNFGSLQNGMEENVPFAHQVQEVSKNDTNGFSTATPNTSLPNSALFITNPDNPDYFIQTDPRFTNYQNFLSSDYMLDQLSLDPTTLHKRLGDGYYEQKLVREQIMQLTGKRFLDGFSSDEEQYMTLLNSGVEFAKEYGISVGIALSAQQMQNLTKDVVLLVEKDVILSDGTKTTALVPQLYAAASKVNLSGSLISANSININVANTLSNSGTIYSDTTTNIQANALTNNQGYIKANNALAITTTNDLSNLSGSIEGSNINLKSTEGSIINKTLTNEMTAAHKVGDEHYVITGKKATIKSTGGNIILDAGKNIENSGADIKATNSISLKAGDKIIVDTVTDNRSYDFKLKNGYMKGEGTTNIASNISAGGDIMSQSGGDTKIIGANVKAGENIILKAGSSLDILAVVDSDYETSKFVDKGSWGKKKTTNNATLEQGVVSTNIDGKNVIVDANDDINIQGSLIHATDNIIATTKEGDINVLAASYEESELHQITKKGTLGLNKSMNLKSTDSQKLYETLLKTDTAHIVLNSGKDINIIASNVDSASDVQLKVFDSLNILAGEELSSSVNEHKSSKLNLLNLLVGVATAGLVPTGSIYTQKIKEKGNYDTNAKSSNIKAGGNIIADTGTTNIVGSNLEAAENIAISADTGGINITTAQELTNAKTREKKIDVKLTNIFDMAQSATDQLGSGQTSIKLNIATATYDDIKTDAKGVNNISSSINAKNGSVILDSLDDITITGSNVKATDIISLNSQIGNIDIKNATDSKDLKNEETHGQADVSVTVRNEYVEIATAIENTAQAVEQLKDVKAQYSNYKKEVKSLERKLSQLKEDYKNGVIGVDHEDIGDLEDLIENVKDQEKYQIAAIGAATANLASANLAVAKQIATAAASSGTSGFNVGVALDVEGSTTKTNTSAITSIASNLSSDTILMQTDNTMATHTTIQGSNVTASNLAIDTHNLNVLASQDTYKEEMDNKSINGSIAATLYGAATGPSVSLGYGEQHDNIDSLTNNNSNLNATNMLLSVTNDASFIGATVRADNLDMFVGNNLNVESLRDEYSSNSNGYNISAGISFGSDSDYAGKTTAEQKNLNNTVGVRTSSDIAGGNIGGGVNSGSTTSKQVVLTSITANNADITVGGNTNLKGSLIAAGYYDENGNFVDNGNLNLTTNTLTFSNLNSTSYSTNTSVGGGVSLNQNKQGETLPNASSATYNASSGISYSKEKTLATIGSGNLTITDKENSDDTTKLNRNTDNLAKELYSGGVSSDVSATIDMRMFTEDGRKDIAEDIVKAGMVVSTIEKIATNATVDATDFFKETEKQYITYETIKQKIQTDPELAKILSNPALSEEAKNIIINAVTNQVMIELGYTPTENNLIATTEPGRDGVQIEGFYSLETGEGYINDLYNLSNYDLLSTAGTETQRAMDDQDNWDFSQEGEMRTDRAIYAQDFGESIADYTDFILSQNDYGSLSTTANPLVTPSDSVLANNAEFEGLDKTQGDNNPVVLLLLGLSLYANTPDVDEQPVTGLPLADLHPATATIVMIDELMKNGLTDEALMNMLLKKTHMNKEAADQIVKRLKSKELVLVNTVDGKTMIMEAKQAEEFIKPKFTKIEGSGKGSPLPVPDVVTAKNGLNYKSNSKHTAGQNGNRGNAGIEPKNSLELFENSKQIEDKRFAFGDDGSIHQFTDSNSADGWHWAGASSDANAPLKPNNKTKSLLKKAFPEQKKNKLLK